MSNDQNNECPCTRDCVRHGNHEACKASHHERGYPTACERIPLDTVLRFLKDCKTFYVATVEGDQPRVRPFGAALFHMGKIYIGTNNQKPVSRQMKANPRIEISATAADGRWLRLSATAVPDDNRDDRQAMLDELPEIASMYNADDGLFEVFYLKDATADICTFGVENERYKF